ncbi:ribonuclease E, partial [Escherichia coli O8:H10]
SKSRDEQQQSRRERNRRRNDEKRQAQQEVKVLNREEQPVLEVEAEQEDRVQVMPRRKQRQLSQKVRFESAPSADAGVDEIAAATPVTDAQASHTELAKVDLPAVVEQPVQEQEESSENRDNAGMPRRSRRSPRHLRVSGQRRRRYRDERYPTQSPMPLTVACASPEMASGKVWIRYPVAQNVEPVQDETTVEAAPEAIQQPIVEPVAEPIAAAVSAEPAVVEPAVVEPAVVEPTVVEPTAVEPTVVEPQAAVSEPQPAAVDTTHPEAIETPVDEQPQLIAPEDVPVAEHIAEIAEPAEAPAEVIEEVKAAEPVAEAQPDAEVKPAVEAQPVVETQPEPVAKPAVEPKPEADVKPAVAAEPVAAKALHSFATAPMTRAPAPEYVPEPPRHSDWVRPAFDFDGKGSAGGHSATHQATAPATRPQQPE